MAQQLQSALPARFDAGTTVKYTRLHGDYPANDGWALTLYLNGGSAFSIVGIANGSAFDVTIPASKTATVSVSGCSTTQGTKIVTRSAGSFTTDGVLPGYLLGGSGIPTGAYVKTVDSATQATISEAAEATGAGLSFTFRFPPGNYAWRELVTKAGETEKAAEGVVAVQPAISGAPAGAFLSLEEELLPLVEDIIRGRIGRDTASYNFADVARQAEKFDSWLSFRAHLKAVTRQQRFPGKILKAEVTFS